VNRTKPATRNRDSEPGSAENGANGSTGCGGLSELVRAATLETPAARHSYFTQIV